MALPRLFVEAVTCSVLLQCVVSHCMHILVSACCVKLSAFLWMCTGGIQVICRNLVDTNRRLINTSPSLVSSIMQYFGSARPDANNGRRSTSYSDSPTDTAIQNFALLG